MGSAFNGRPGTRGSVQLQGFRWPNVVRREMLEHMVEGVVC